MLLQLAVADAYGTGFEYTSGCNLPVNNLSSYHQHPLHTDLKPGMYSDDSQFSIAVAEMVAENRSKSFEFSEISCAEKFVQVFKRDPRKGYSKGFQSTLEEVNSGKELLSSISKHGRTDKNGAAMRIAPLVFLTNDLNELFRITEIVSKVTHEGTAIEAAKCVIFCCWALRYKAAKLIELPNLIKEQFDPKLNLNEFWLDRVKSKTDLGLITVRAALTCILTSNGTLSDIIKNAIDLGGDTDTTATIAAAIASQSFEVNDDVTPKNSKFNHLVFQLENGKYGVNYLKFLDTMLEGKKSFDF